MPLTFITKSMKPYVRIPTYINVITFFGEICAAINLHPDNYRRGFCIYPLWLLVFNSITFSQIAGTAIIVLKYPTRIIIAADSKAVMSGGPDSTVCKITQVGNVFFTQAGLFSYPRTRFNVIKVGVAALESKGSIRERIKLFEEEMERMLNFVLEDMSAIKDTSGFRHITKDMCAAFAGFDDNGVPFLFVRCFKRLPGQKTISLGQSINSDGLANALLPFEIYLEPGCTGSWNPLQLLDSATTTYTLSKTIKSFFNGLLATDCEETIGSPINILYVDKLGARWLEREQNSTCPDIMPYSQK